MGSRGGNLDDQKPEEQKVAPAVDIAELNDLSKGEFRIEAMKMKDAESGTLLWEGFEWDLNSTEEQKVEFPAAMLACKAIGRELVFYSKKIMHDFSIKQVMSMNGQVVESFGFDFGFVMPNTTNSWEQIIDAEEG